MAQLLLLTKLMETAKESNHYTFLSKLFSLHKTIYVPNSYAETQGKILEHTSTCTLISMKQPLYIRKIHADVERTMDV